MSARVLSVSAPAKVNLHLAVGECRSDGYHDVTTVLATLDLADTVVLTPAPSLTLSCEPGLGIQAEENIAYRAAARLGDAVGREPGVAIELHKRIPHGAGLGGGSSDAAAVLAGLSAWWGLDPCGQHVLSVAAGLGADVPFFLTGGIALYAGRGDRFVRQLPFVELDVLIVRPDEPVSTKAAYAAFDRQPPQTLRGPEAMMAALESGQPQRVAQALDNNMTDASSTLVESVAHALAWAKALPGSLGSALAGSGSAVFAVLESGADVQQHLETAKGRGWWAGLTRTCATGVAVRESKGEDRGVR